MATGRRRRVLFAIVLGGGIAVASVTAVQAGSPAKPPSALGVGADRMGPGRLVNVRTLPPAPTGAKARDIPFLSRNPQALAALKASPARESSMASTDRPTWGPRTNSSVVPSQEQLTVFPGMSLQRQIDSLGSSEGRQPPDTQVAAGPGQVMEMDNRAGSFWTKAGTLMPIAGNPFDLQPFFVPAPGPPSCPSSSCLIGDPRLLFDAISGRWLASANGVNLGNFPPQSDVGTVFFAISSTSDPTGTWMTFAFTLPAPGSNPDVIADGPTLGVSDDKVTLAWSDFLTPGTAPCVTPGPFCYFEQEIWVIDKGQLLAGNPNPARAQVAANGNRFGVVPVQSLTSTSTQYLVYNNADPAFLVQNTGSPTLALIALTGTPSAPGGVVVTESDLALTSGTTAPPDAVQASSSRLIATGDDRLESAVWESGKLWTSASVGCAGLTPPPNSHPKGACLRLWQISTGLPTTVSQDVLVAGNAGGVGDYLYYPAQSVDAAGNLYVVLSRSNASSFPSAVVMGQLAGSSSLTALATLLAGQGPYDPVTPSCSSVSDWGDYSAAAQDPTDPTDVWVGAEYVPASPNTCRWGTVVGRLTFSGPSISSAAPPSGSRFGGTSVVINGRDFLPGGTTVMFDKSGATALTVTPDQITASSPAHQAGTVSVTVSTPNGQAMTTFTYLPRADLAGPVNAGPPGSSRTLPPPLPGSPPTGKLTTGPLASAPSVLRAAIEALWHVIQSSVQFSNADVSGRRGRAATSRLR